MKYYVGQKITPKEKFFTDYDNTEQFKRNQYYLIGRDRFSNRLILTGDGLNWTGNDEWLDKYFMTEKEASERAFNTKFDDWVNNE